MDDLWEIDASTPLEIRWDSLNNSIQTQNPPILLAQAAIVHLTSHQHGFSPFICISAYTAPAGPEINYQVL